MLPCKLCASFVVRDEDSTQISRKARRASKSVQVSTESVQKPADRLAAGFCMLSIARPAFSGTESAQNCCTLSAHI